MTSNWFSDKVQKYSKLTGYQKPEEHPGALKLDSNENFVIRKQTVKDFITNARKTSDVREYPLGGTERLVNELSKFLKVSSSCIGVGNGSDQILDLILVNFATTKTKVLTSDPTFGFFEQRCNLYSIPMIKIPFSKDMALDVDQFLSKSKSADILYLDSPNNPTGFQFSKNDLQKLIKNFRGLVIIDEAYGDFGSFSAVSMAPKQNNLIVVQTLSKSFGLAGLRIGYFVSNQAFVDVFTRIIQYPYPMNTLAIDAGINALNKKNIMKDAVALIKKERKKITDKLRKYDVFDVFESEANFVLFDAGGIDKRIYKALVEQGISIRKLGQIGKHKGCLRVTVGTPEMNSKFLLAIRDLLE